MKIFDGFSLTVEGEATEAVVQQAKLLANATRREATARGLLAFRKYANLPDGGYAFSVKHGDICRVHVVPATATRAVDTEVETLVDFGSGWITDGRIVQAGNAQGQLIDVVAEFTPTADTQRRLKLNAGAQRLRRYAVEPASNRPDLRSQFTTISQYSRLKPSMYSGKMKRVVQAVMGFGRPSTPSAFRRTIASIGEQPRPGTRPTNAEIAAANEGVQIVYDNRFYRTHGIATSADNKLWLVEVGTRGVLAMPLPLWPRSTTARFRTWCETNDIEATRLLDEFGGFPSGESFATDTRLLDAQIRAGLALRLATESQLAAFYANQPFSSAVGWAFNQRGTEAHNVGFVTNGAGLKVAEHWHTQFTIGAPIAANAQSLAAGATLVASLRGRVSGFTPEYLEVVYGKVGWVSASTLAGFSSLARSDPQAAFAALDGVEVTRYPGGAVVGRAYSGVFYHPSGPTPPPIKFHEPLLGGLLSVDMRREGRNPDYSGVPLVQDTTLHVYFIGDQLKAVKYYWDRTDRTVNEEESNYEDCMYQGEWYKSRRTGSVAVPAGFYTTDMDRRRASTAVEEDWTVVGTRLGRVLSVSDDLANPARGFASRTTWFELQTTYQKWEAPGQRIAVIIPNGVREGCMLIHEESTATYFRSVGYEQKPLGDPWTYTTWRLFGTLSPTGEFIGGFIEPEHMQACGNRLKRKIDASTEGYAPYPCSDLVDEGAWGINCQVVETTASPDTPSPPAQELERRDNVATLRTVLDYPPLTTPFETAPLTHDGGGAWAGFRPWDRNFSRSPGPDGVFQFANAYFNCLGDGNLLVSATQVSGNGPAYIRGTPYREEFLTKNTTFVGVIDG